MEHTAPRESDTMEAALFDDNAPKQTFGLTLNSDLYSKTCAAGIDPSRVAEEALIRALRAKETEKLKAEIRQDMEAVARYVAEHGDPAAELRELFGPPDAA
jgi:post-segregation antitoxin (ccd killing protein)